ncbi:MAG: hypothetical protein JEZ09_12725 [Salinivirgaceae bacterium]|nr:hypothetical protein [Salinivirgaceae bacterium]
MKLWEIFLATIYNLFARVIIHQKKLLPFEQFLSKAYTLLDENSISKLKHYTKSQMHETGFFKDKAGKPDLYYSLFGYFIASSLKENILKQKLAEAISNMPIDSLKDKVHLFCGAILKAQLNSEKESNKKYKLKIIETLNNLSTKDSGYIWFLGIISFYYLQDYYLINKYLKKFQPQIDTSKEEIPCTLIAAELILNKVNKKPTQTLVEKLIKYYRPSGGFAALQKSPIEDLLSTAVCLFALQFASVDLRIIKPDALTFIESLYHDGGFVATQFDKEADIEYTFYGLLAMASLEK